jgi:hypothetical protein
VAEVDFVTFLRLTQGLAAVALGFAVIAFWLRWRAAARRPLAVDRSPAKGSARSGVLYAFTLGMMPWAKESTRRHLWAYLRGIGFHVGIFAGLLALLASPWWTSFPSFARTGLAILTALGAILGAAGTGMRLVERNLRRISTPDDHASVLFVTAFLAATSAALARPAWMPAMFLSAALMLIYAPLGKIRHCIYFFLSRLFFGLFLGRRAILHPHASIPSAAITERVSS